MLDVTPLFKYDVTGPDAGTFLARIMVRNMAGDQDTVAGVNTQGMANIESDCGFVDASGDGSLMLSPGSDCVDAGTTTELPGTDAYGNPRQSGPAPDIGPHELTGS